MSEIRLQKYLAEAGVASRRGGEALILEGRVLVNGQKVRELGVKVRPDRDEVVLDGKSVRPKRKIYVALHKPRHFMCSRDPQGERRTAHQLLPPAWRHLQTAGRLDYESEGLILMTNDGEFALRITHPRYQVVKKYRVVVAGKAEPELAARMEKGVFDRGEKLRAQKAVLVSASNSRSVIEADLTEGKKREIRRLLSRLGHRVERLSRVQIGRLKLGELPSGKYRALTAREVQTLLRDAEENPKPRFAK